jgi:hypothetical protein
MVNAFFFPIGNQMTSSILSFLVIYLSYPIDIRLKYVILKIEKFFQYFLSHELFQHNRSGAFTLRNQIA